MRLLDCIAQSREPFIVQDQSDGRQIRLNNSADFAVAVTRCPLRYVLSDDLTDLCADLAYSKGARTVACADLLHVPAETLWVEWCNEPWQQALSRYGFPIVRNDLDWSGRRGALIRADPRGRRGTIRTFWSEGGECEVLASSVEAYFDFDTPAGETPEPYDRSSGEAGRIYDPEQMDDDVLGRCFRFRYEHSWSEYYRRAAMTAPQREAVWRFCLGTIAMDVPMLLAFFLLLATRGGLPQQRHDPERLNRQRGRSGKPRILDHIEVRAPILPEYHDGGPLSGAGLRRHPRLHHVRGHLVRRGSRIFWRMPHLRGRARAGAVRARTVVWTFERPDRGGGAHASPGARIPKNQSDLISAISQRASIRGERTQPETS
jgi:hypothetical protein